MPLSGADALNFVSGLEFIEKKDIYSVLSAITDGSRFQEFKSTYGSNLITGFAFIRGQLTGILANCGSLSSPDGQKGAHFVQLCDFRGLPMIFLQNSGRKSEEIVDGVTLKDRAKFAQRASVTSVPKISLNLGGCFGDELMTMCGPSMTPRFIFSWPRAKMSKLEQVIKI